MSRLRLVSAVVLLSLPAIVRAQESLPSNSIEAASPVQVYTEEQLAQVVDFLRAQAPACPSALLETTAQRFLEDIAVHRPEQLAKISSGSSLDAFKSPLLQRLAATASGDQYKNLREEIARKRIALVLTANALGSAADAGALMDKIKGSSDYYLQRVVDGKVDDEELLSMLKRARGTDAATEKRTAQPKVLSVAEIVSEFVRHNQVGAAADRLVGYKMEAELTTSTGETQELFLYRMRPDRFRLVVKSKGETKLLLGASGTEYWQQVAGKPAQRLSAKDMGGRIYLAEFLNPLFDGDNTDFTREADGAVESRKVFRVSVKRADGTHYISCIDQESFKEVARENEDGTKVLTSDFRDVSGLTFAFREKVIDAKGREGVFVVKKIVPNPGIVQSLFDPPAETEPNYFKVEQMTTGTVAVEGDKR